MKKKLNKCEGLCCNDVKTISLDYYVTSQQTAST